jgi:glycosyltransferase involved in cell wall biosynthesis
MPMVSVVIPSYNHEKYVGEAIASVLNQTYQDFEIIITDDGSTDGTVQEIQKFKDPRIRLYCLEKNQGQFVAMRKCIEEATGEYVAVLNSDDAFLPTKLKKQVEHLDAHPELAAVFTYAAIIDDDGNDFTDKTHFYYNIFKQPNRTRHEWLNYFFYKGNCLCHPSVVIRSECHKTIGHYEERFGLLADLDFWVRLCLKREIYVIPENLVKFRVRKGEKNPSGVKLEARIRDSYEFSPILSHYLTISAWEEFTKIFENAEPYCSKLEDDLIPFAVAMVALKANSPVHQLFGLNTLFRLLQDSKIARKMKDQCAFGYAEFIKLTGEIDIFNMTRIFEIERLQQENYRGWQAHVQNLESILQDREQHIRNLERQREENYRDWQAHVKNLERTLEDREQHIQNLEAALRDKESHIGNLERQREENYRDWQAHEKHLRTIIEDKQTHIGNLETVVRDKDAHIGSLEAAMRDKDVHIGSLEATVSEKEATLNRIYNSYGLGALLICNKMIDKLFPFNSKRRRYAKTILNTIKTPKNLIKNCNKSSE